MSINTAVRPQVPLKLYIFWKLMMSAIQIQTKIQIQRKIQGQIQRQRQIKGKPITPMMWYIFENISHHSCHWFSLHLFLSLYVFVCVLYLSVYLSLFLYFHPNLDSWHHQLSENIRLEGYLRLDGSVTAHLWTKEKLLRDGWTGRKSKVLQEVLADLKRLAADDMHK